MTSGYSFLPAANYEIPGFDPFWETAALHRDWEDDDSQERLELPLAAGETLPFAAMLFLSGSSTCTILVNAPENSNGGFYISGLDDGGSYALATYGADNFNAHTAELWQVGVSGTLEGWSTIRIEGVVGAGAEGTLKISVSSGRIKAASFIKGFRQYDGREYGVAS